MATNFVQPGRTITITSAGDAESGDVVVVGELAGIALGAAATGENLDLALEGVYSVSKVSALALSVGQVVYFDAGDSLATDDDDTGANPLLGHAIAAAGNPSATVEVRLSN